ncbi:GlxA family transcriptional regulator [Sulfitobacter albidus]|uniref:GlxA family transcriptional regulator n=1 Tax=Sulfitobacter albidus TaxID=2829501 RepID=A0A975PLR3_9RHOB|nr:GlxA family transcriptional regulator [Sulfitobacter albidus]QUJ75993.1 GlxA family transcriptional regulator [Sulfitobacter albidus]
MCQRLTVLLFDGFSNHCLANMVEPLRAANTLSGRCLYDWRFCSLAGGPVRSSAGLQVAPEGALHDQRADMLIVMPSYGFLELDTRATAHALNRAARRHRMLAGLDMGSWLLARAGLLDGHRATVHWDELSRFEESFAHVDAVRARFVIDGTRITCSGALAAFDLASELIRRDHGALLAEDVADLLMSTPQARPERPDDSPVARALRIMQANLETPLPIGEIARRIGCSQRRIEARVRAELQTTPQALYRRQRLALVRRLAEETDYSIVEIAGRSGYESASAMTRAFRAEFGRTPSAFRKR